jgi:hypothetical protein
VACWTLQSARRLRAKGPTPEQRCTAAAGVRTGNRDCSKALCLAAIALVCDNRMQPNADQGLHATWFMAVRHMDAPDSLAHFQWAAGPSRAVIALHLVLPRAQPLHNALRHCDIPRPAQARQGAHVTGAGGGAARRAICPCRAPEGLCWGWAHEPLRACEAGGYAGPCGELQSTASRNTC